MDASSDEVQVSIASIKVADSLELPLHPDQFIALLWLVVSIANSWCSQ